MMGANGNGWLDYSSEHAVLGLLLTKTNLIATITDSLDEGDFYAFGDRRVFAVVRDLHRERPPGLAQIDIAAIYNRLKPEMESGDVPSAYLGELMECACSPENLNYHVETVRAKAARRKAARLFSELSHRAARRDGPLDELVADAEAACTTLKPAVTRPALVPVPASHLKACDPATQWIMEGCLARGCVTLLSAFWKAGKTTWLSHLLRMLEHGGEFCGKRITRGTALVVTEESESRWAERRDKLRLGDHVSFVVRPFKTKPTAYEWTAFVASIESLAAPDLVILDTVANLWPVQDENDAARVQEALLPLHRLSKSALLLVHHLGKADGKQATGSRGSGALTAWVDAILEFRRFSPDHHSDRRRVIHGFARWENVPNELVVELTKDGDTYASRGTKLDVQRELLCRTLMKILPNYPPGLRFEEIKDRWDPQPPPAKQDLLAALRDGHRKDEYGRQGIGKKGNPFTFWARTRPD